MGNKLQRFLTYIILGLTIIMLAGFSFEAWYNRNYLRLLKKKHFPVTELSGIVIRLNRSLSNFVQLAIYSRDEYWLAQYDLYLPAMNQTLKDLSKLTTKEDEKFLFTRSEVNKYELEILKKLNSNASNEELIKLLKDPYYLKQKEMFTSDLSVVARLLAEKRAFTLLRAERVATLVFVVVVLGILIWIIIGFLILRKMRINAQKLSSAEDELREKQVQLIQSGKLAALGELIAGIAHELNNPLTFIKGFNKRIKVSFLQKNFGEVMDYINEVDENCDRMIKIVQNYKEFSRQRADINECIDVNEVILKSFSLMNEQLNLHNIKSNLDLTPKQPAIWANFNHLEQVFLNLISNARDAIVAEESKKGGEIGVRTIVEDNEVYIHFQDDGIGVKEEDFAKILNPFFSTKDVGKGTGLGLSITHEIISKHNGAISYNSKYLEGTFFKIRFPKYIKEEND